MCSLGCGGPINECPLLPVSHFPDPSYPQSELKILVDNLLTLHVCTSQSFNQMCPPATPILATTLSGCLVPMFSSAGAL